MIFEHFAVGLSPQGRMSPLQPVTKTVSMDIQEEEVTIKIVREPGTGLGISIAGGIGSTPYRGDDEVGNSDTCVKIVYLLG